ncbi:MAG TPA: TolC family protein [Bryobacteraceae bacterium]|nr:TolC family protein [Bryobacteraceae bacterium]
MDIILQKTVSSLAILSLIIAPCSAQSSPEMVERPHGIWFVRPYRAATAPPISLTNSDHLHSLIRAGKLYLTVQDAIALAIENNLDLEVDRYGPLQAQWSLQRAQGGGPLRGVTNGSSLVNQATSGQGVVGSENSLGLGSNASTGGTNTGGATISQIGPVTQNLDPVFQNATSFSHVTSPQPTTVVSQVDALVGTHHIINSFVQQGLLTGGFVQVSMNESYLKENAPTDYLNPSVAPVAQVYINHNLLNGFGTAVNGRFIRVAEKNVRAAQETFRSQLLNAVASVLNLYWDLVTDDEDLAVRQRAADQAQKFYDDTRRQIELGVLPRFEASRAQSNAAGARQLLALAQAMVQQQQNLLKNAISRNGLEDELLDAAEVVPLDHIEVPAQDNLPPLRELVAKALAGRPDVALDQINDESAEISALGTANGLLPSLRASAKVSAAGLSGMATPPVVIQGQSLTADKYYVGGLGNALGQVFRDNFPSRSAGALFAATFHNRIAQGDYGVEQLQLRQSNLLERRNRNQMVVDISNQMVALRQARARYSQAVDSRQLQEQLLEKSQQSFSFGGATISDVETAQSAVVTAQETEVSTRSAFSHARIALDQVLGQTLEVNHVSVDPALNSPRAAKQP